MKTRKALIFVIGLLLLTAVAAGAHWLTRDQVTEGCVQLLYGEKSYEVEISKLEYEQVTGTRVNGKGEEIPVEASGILLKNLLNAQKITEYSKVTVKADDSYSAEMTREEVQDASKVYLLHEEGELRLIVFGDTNSKRSVSNVVQIVIE